MCYSGKCAMEQYSGDCNDYKYNRYFGGDKTVYSLCTLGGVATCQEEEEYIEEARHNLVFQYMYRIATGRINPKMCGYKRKIGSYFRLPNIK